MRFDIENKILIPFLILIIIPTLVVGGVFYWNSYRLLVDSQTDGMAKDLDMMMNYLDALSQEAEEGFISRGEAQDKALNYLKEYSGNRISVVDKSGILLIGSGDMDIPPAETAETRFKQVNSSIMAFAEYPRWGWTIGIVSTTRKFTYELLEMQKYTLLVAIIGIIIAVELSILLAHNISRPIKSLAEVCDNISAGRFDGWIPIERKDEIGVLARALNNMLIKQKENNKKLVEMKKSNEDILRSIDIGIIAINKGGRVIGINQAAENFLAARYIVREKNEYLGTFFSQLMRHLNATLVNQRPEYNMVWQLEGEGGIRYIEVNTSLLRSEDGSVNGAICSFSDITNRKKVENRIERVNRLVSLGELAAGLAHEIRNPLAGMKTSSQVLYNRFGDNPSNLSLIEGILHEIDRLNFLITDLLNFARPHPPDRRETNIAEVVKKAVELTENRMIKHGIKLDMEVGTSDTRVYVDRNQMEQVFLNIIINAIKAMEDGGVLSIKIYHKGEGQPRRLKIAFSDTGTGIDSENINRIFDPFYTTDPGGTGLGLSVVHKLVTENDGDIEVFSKVDHGTTFVLGLPLSGGEDSEEKNSDN